MKMLKEELKSNHSDVNTKNKEELVKLMLCEQNIPSETSNDISKEISKYLKV
jgi:hypothetical protein